MKKRRIAFLLCLVLAFALLSIGAWAFSVPDGQVGVDYYYELASTDASDPFTTTSSSGGVPGLYIGATDTVMYITGNPTTAGTYNFSIFWESENGAGAPGYTIVIAPAAPSTAEPTADASPDTSASPDASTSPSAGPVYYGAPTVTSHPKDKQVKVGESAEFTANATNATWWAWRFIKGNETVIFDVVGNRFPGLKIEGGNDLTFRLSNIPAELNGWSVACIFGDAYGQTALSNTAKITVGDNATPSPTASATPEATATPTVSPTPTATPEATPTVTPSATPEPTATPAPQKGLGGGNAMLMLILIALVLVLAIVAVILILRLRKKGNEDYIDDYDDEPFDNNRRR